jgi:hypothetical protein
VSNPADIESPWLYLGCPSCQGRLRFRASHAPRRFGKCPHCGARVEATGKEPTAPVPVVGPGPVSNQYREREEDRPAHERLPRPPAWPLWRGIYSFPWHRTCLGVWILLTIGFTLLAALAVFAYYLGHTLQNNPAGFLIVGASVNVFAAVAVYTAWMLSHAASYFLAVVQDSAGGVDEVDWPEDSLPERLFRLGYLIYVGAFGGPLIIILAVVLHDRVDEGSLRWAIIALPIALVFPIVLWSSMSGESQWLPVHGEVMTGLARRPLLLATVWLVGAIIVAVLAAFVYATVCERNAALSPVAGLVWATGLLIYARLLGRGAWILSGASDRRPRRRKKRRRRVTSTEEG